MFMHQLSSHDIRVFQGRTKTKILIGVRRRILKIQSERPRIRTIVPGAAPIERHERRRTCREIRIQDADFFHVPIPLSSIRQTSRAIRFA